MKVTKYRVIGTITVVLFNGLKDLIKVDTFCYSTNDYSICNLLRAYTYAKDYRSVVEASVDVYKVYDDAYSVYMFTRDYSGKGVDICCDMAQHYV